MAKAEEIKPAVEIGTKDEAMWRITTQNLKTVIENLEKEMTINKAFLEKAEELLAKEHKKSKSWFSGK